MGCTIHATAIISGDAQLGENVVVGPHSIIEGNAVIGDCTEIASNVLIGSDTTIGRSGAIYHGAVVGSIAQDLKYRGEKAVLTIGDNCIIREYCTINRGTAASGATIVGNNCALLAYCHIGHDCVVGNNFVSSNSLALAGHVIVGNNVGCGGFVGVHQFCRIGDHAYLGAWLLVHKDVLPYSLCAITQGTGTERLVGINTVGLERRGFDQARRTKIKNIMRSIFKEGSTVQEAIGRLTVEMPLDEDVKAIVGFIQSSTRGIYRMD
jgi:UDP-N-acetylglucosamine acyltransferase